MFGPIRRRFPTRSISCAAQGRDQQPEGLRLPLGGGDHRQFRDYGEGQKLPSLAFVNGVRFISVSSSETSSRFAAITCLDQPYRAARYVHQTAQRRARVERDGYARLSGAAAAIRPIWEFSQARPETTRLKLPRSFPTAVGGDTADAGQL